MLHKRMLLLLCLCFPIAAACDPEDVDRAKREASYKAVQAQDAATQAAADIKEEASELIDKSKPYVERAKAAAIESAHRTKIAATQAAEKVKTATTQAVERVREKMNSD